MVEQPRAHARRLVIVDMQHVFRDAGSWQVPRYDEIVPVISGLQARLTQPAVFTRFVRDPTEPGAWSAYYDRWQEMRRPPEATLWDITMPVPPDSPVVSRPTFSAWGPELARSVPPGGELVLTGVATDCCVLATALAALDAGRFVTVVADGCAGADDEVHERTLRTLDLFDPLCRVVPSSAVTTAA